MTVYLIGITPQLRRGFYVRRAVADTFNHFINAYIRWLLLYIILTCYIPRLKQAPTILAYPQ